jgi:ERCC4-type nuclease
MNYLDNREHELIKHLDTWTVKQLQVADAWIGVGPDGEVQPGGILVERKEVNDFQASMLDGRYREQRTRMQGYAAEHGAQILYILEGDLATIRTFTKETAWKWLIRLQFVHKIQVFQTRDAKETAEYLKTLASKWQEDQAEFRDGKTTAYETTLKQHTKGEQRDDPRIFAISVLTCCKGISPATAEAILKGCGGSLTAVWSATEAQIAALQATEKSRVGPAKAKKLWALLHHTDLAFTDPRLQGL